MQNFYSPKTHPGLKLDASDLAWLSNELKYVSQKQFERLEYPNLGRKIIPDISEDIPEGALTVEFTEWKGIGEAKFVGRNADDLPRVEVSGKPYNKNIEVIADSWHYTIFEIKNTIRSGGRLDVKRAAQARIAIETRIDRTLGKGYAPLGLEGLFNLTGLNLVTATSKTGGGTYWSAASKVSERVRDVMKLAQAAAIRIQNTYAQGDPAQAMARKVRIVMPDANLLSLQSEVLDDGTGRTAYEFLINQPYIESIWGWWAAVGSAANATDDRMVAFPPSEDVLGSLIPVGFQELPEEIHTFERRIPCYGLCGGVVLHRPLLVSAMDTIDYTA